MLVQSRLRLAADRTGVEVFLRQQADLRDKILDGVTHQKLVMSLFRTIQSFQQLTVSTFLSLLVPHNYTWHMFFVKGI